MQGLSTERKSKVVFLLKTPTRQSWRIFFFKRTYSLEFGAVGRRRSSDVISKRWGCNGFASRETCSGIWTLYGKGLLGFARLLSIRGAIVELLLASDYNAFLLRTKWCMMFISSLMRCLWRRWCGWTKDIVFFFWKWLQVICFERKVTFIIFFSQKEKKKIKLKNFKKSLCIDTSDIV